MNRIKRPLSVTVLGWVYIAVGAVGFAFHFSELLALRYDSVWVELTEAAAILSGAFMLRGHNWARWVALAWIALHVAVSAFHPVRQLAVHCVFCAIIGWVLFRPAATRYFHRARIEST